ncbi:cobalamin biosynthesis protein CobG [Streptomyces purpureus]|uniref:cobalamin biosynthesis protein CobG n=1 Tax=Streptomyces purpureus TaxID=1951 RepID=UPI00379CF19C
MSPTPPNAPNPGEPLIRDRGDACPGALRLHAADDGRLARLRLPGGRLTGRQVMVLADAAESLGDGQVSVTSRGNVELRGLGEDCGARLAGLLGGAGLVPSETHERVRNIVASPAAGLDGLGHADVQLWSRELDALLCGRAWTAALSGRFLFVLDDGRGDVAGLGGDVTLLAAPSHVTLRVGARSFRLPDPETAPRAALAAAEAFLAAATAAGTGAWRVKELPESHEPDVAGSLERAGIAAEAVRSETAAAMGGSHGAATHATADPLGPAAHATAGTLDAATHATADPLGPDAGATADPLGPDAHATAGTLDAAAHATADPLGPDAGATTSPFPPEAGAHGGPLRPGLLGDGSLCVLAPLGRFRAGQLRALVPPAQGEVRLTPWRGAVVSGFADRTAAGARLGELADAGLITAPDSPWAGVGACTGRPGCGKSLSDVRADATPGPGGPYALPVHFSGCARRCGHPHGDWVDVVATADGQYTVNGAPTPRTALTAAVTQARTRPVPAPPYPPVPEMSEN